MRYGYRRFAAAALAVIAVAACQDRPEPEAGEAEAAEATPAPDSAGAREATPPTLVEIMRGLETDMERVAHGIWLADFDSIAAGARAVADHPQVGPEERAGILGTLGDGAAGFREADMRVHDTAVTLAERAGAENLPGVLDALTELQAGCVACHAGYRATLQAARQ